MVEALNLLYSLYTGTQLMIAIIDARSIANAYYYGVTYAQQGLQRMRRSTTLCPSKVSVTFSALSASVIAISSCIPVQNASLIAEIPFNWTIANTRYGIISVHVVGHFKNKNLQGFNIDRVTTCKIWGDSSDQCRLIMFWKCFAKVGGNLSSINI